MDDDSDSNEFFFESEHLALKNNKDYHKLIKCISILEAQRVQAIKDIDTLKLQEKHALENSETFLQKLKSGTELGVPRRQTIVEIPKIDWIQYSKYLPSNFQIPLSSVKTEDTEERPEEKSLTETFVDNTSKHVFHSRLWTNEEQKRLEELLIEYPPEPIEMKRFAKIAKALGNRTTKQVCSRVQKYFIKLHKAGLPIPGRIPKIIDRRRSAHKHQRFNRFYRPSTFFPDNEVPVHMTDFDDDVPGPSTQPNVTTVPMIMAPIKKECSKMKELNDPTSNSIPTNASRKLELLLKIKLDKQQGQSLSIHNNFRCTYCEEEPIVGTRWHCNDCDSQFIDFCTDCMVEQLDSTEPHTLTHCIEPIRYSNNALTNEILANTTNELKQRQYLIANSSYTNFKSENNIDADIDIKMEPMSTYDEDYSPSRFAENSDSSYYNYLDPNFLPA